MTPAQRSLRARIGAFALHAQGGTSTAAGTAAFLDRFTREVDPEGTLAPEERARRAAYARKAYFSGLSLKASIARSNRPATMPASVADEAPARNEPVAGRVGPARTPREPASRRDRGTTPGGRLAGRPSRGAA